MKIRKNKIIVSVISTSPSKNIQQAEQPIIKILKEDDNEKIVETKDSNIIVTSTCDKKRKILNITTKKIAGIL
ncbi:hypothetical protein ACT7C7_30350 [Bacillus cereus]